MQLTLTRSLAVMLVTAALLLTGGAPAYAGRDVPPTSITATVTLTDVYCAGPCCCAHPYVLAANGHYYDRGPWGYCKWFRPLHDGQVVTLTLRLVR